MVSVGIPEGGSRHKNIGTLKRVPRVVMIEPPIVPWLSGRDLMGGNEQKFTELRGIVSTPSSPTFFMRRPGVLGDSPSTHSRAYPVHVASLVRAPFAQRKGQTT